jgi:hypothetical protein
MRSWIRVVSSRPYGRVIAAIIAEAQADPELGEQCRARFLQPGALTGAACVASLCQTSPGSRARG